MDEMHAYPTDDIADHVFDGACQCDYSVQEVVWDDEPDTVYLLVLHQPVTPNA